MTAFYLRLQPDPTLSGSWRVGEADVQKLEVSNQRGLSRRSGGMTGWALWLLFAVLSFFITDTFVRLLTSCGGSRTGARQANRAI